MTKTIAIIGAGPGVGMAVAERFGNEGFRVALVARNADKLAAMVKDLQSRGIEAAAFAADVCDRAGLSAALNYARVLHQELAPDGIYVGILSIAGLVVQRGQDYGVNTTKGLSSIAAQDIADLHWDLYSKRDRVEAIIGDVAVLKHHIAGG